MHEINIDFHGKEIKAKYLDWYEKAKTEGFHGVPGWVIKIDDILTSNLTGELANFGALYAFTQSISSVSIGSTGSNEDESAVKFNKALVVIPETKSYTKILERESKRILTKELVIEKLKNAGEAVNVQKKFIYYNVYIDHTEIIGGKELAMLFAFDRLRVVENIYSDVGQKTGLVAYEVEIYSGKISA